MFKLFRRNKKKKLSLVDIEGLPIEFGDRVESLRYDLGTCELIKKEEGIFYRSIETQEEVSFAKMIDAHTKRQKVRRID